VSDAGRACHLQLPSQPPPSAPLLSPVMVPKASDRAVAGSKPSGTGAMATAALTIPPLWAAVKTSSVATGAASCGCPATGCPKASSSGGRSVVTVAQPEPPPLCSRALPLELAVSLSRCRPGRDARPCGTDRVRIEIAEPQQPAAHRSLDVDAAEEGELPVKRQHGPPVQSAGVPAKKMAGAGAAAQHKVVDVHQLAESDVGVAADKIAPVLSSAAIKQRMKPPSNAAVPTATAASTLQNRDGHPQSTALAPGGETPPATVAASTAAAVSAPMQPEQKQVARPAAAAADRHASPPVPLQPVLARAQALAARPCAPASVVKVPHKRTAPEEAALRAAAERETLLRQLNRQARSLIQVRLFEAPNQHNALGKARHYSVRLDHNFQLLLDRIRSES